MFFYCNLYKHECIYANKNERVQVGHLVTLKLVGERIYFENATILAAFSDAHFYCSGVKVYAVLVIIQRTLLNTHSLVTPHFPVHNVKVWIILLKHKYLRHVIVDKSDIPVFRQLFFCNMNWPRDSLG